MITLIALFLCSFFGGAISSDGKHVIFPAIARAFIVPTQVYTAG